MAEKAGELAILSNPPSFVVVDSTLDLEIEDLTCQRTEKLSLMDLSDVAWSIYVFKFDSGPFLFGVRVDNFPEELKSKSKAVFSVSCDGRDVALTVNRGSLLGSITVYTSSHVEPFVHNKITLSCRLLITCEATSSLREKFYDSIVPKKSILGRVAGMLGDPTFSDFAFIVGGREFNVHMNILAAASPVMKKLFTTDLQEAKTKKCTVDAIDPETFGQMLRFIYSGDIPEDLQAVAMPLYEAAHYYGIESLKAICDHEMRCSLTLDNVLEVFEWAQPYDLEDLKMRAWTIIKRDILKIFVELKNEPLSLEKINEIIKQREQEKTFWTDFEEQLVKKTDNTS